MKKLRVLPGSATSSSGSKESFVPIHLHYYEDYATQEIAEILGIPAATVRTRLRRGRELLKKKLMEAEGYAGQENV